MLHESPADPFLKYGIALEYMSRNEDDTALQFFDEIKTSNPAYLPLYYQMAKIYERMNQVEKAIKTYNDGILVARDQKDMHTLNELQNALDELW